MLAAVLQAAIPTKATAADLQSQNPTDRIRGDVWSNGFRRSSSTRPFAPRFELFDFDAAFPFSVFNPLFLSTAKVPLEYGRNGSESATASRELEVFSQRVQALRDSLHRVVVGQDDTIDLLLICA